MRTAGTDRLTMIALDLGASNGRAVRGTLQNGRITVEETARFANDAVRVNGHWCWDIPRLLSNIEDALLGATAGTDAQIDSVGIDSWGVDFGLIGGDGTLVTHARHYRDEQTAGMQEAAFSRIPRGVLFRETGNAFERYNTLFQILGMAAEGSDLIERADTLLMIADLFVYFLTGTRKTEFTAASTSQLLRAGSAEWNQRVLQAMNIPDRLFTQIDFPGSIRGELRLSGTPVVAGIPVVAVGHHDTASAVAGIPGLAPGRAFLSSGTWSLIGVEVDRPILTDEAMELGYTNEGGVDGKYRLLQNIMGLWILQECKRSWDNDGLALAFAELSALAEAAPPFVSFIDPASGFFFAPGTMPYRVREFCRRSGQVMPEDRGALVRCVLESLALKYRHAIENLERVSGHAVTELHIVGGGSRNRLLNQLTASSLDLPVVSGPEEAAIFGNLVAQGVALGAIRSFSEGRESIGNSVARDTYYPQDHARWDDAYDRFQSICRLNDFSQR